MSDKLYRSTVSIIRVSFNRSSMLSDETMDFAFLGILWISSKNIKYNRFFLYAIKRIERSVHVISDDRDDTVQ